MIGGALDSCASGYFSHLTGECCIDVTASFCTCTRQCSNLWHHRCSMTVPGLGNDMGDWNSHNYGGGG